MSRALGEMGAKLAITARDTEELAGAASQHYPHAAWHKVMTLNVDAPFVLTREVARRSMIARCAGRVINIARSPACSATPPGMHTIAYNRCRTDSSSRSASASWLALRSDGSAVMRT